MSTELEAKVEQFLNDVVKAMALAPPTLEFSHTDDGVRVNMTGDGLEIFVRRRGEVLDAFQHVANAVFRADLADKQHVLIDCLDYRKGKDAELRQMAQLLGERAKTTGTAQEIGPLNPYARRLVHLAIAEDPTLSSESVGDAFLKTVIITADKP